MGSEFLGTAVRRGCTFPSRIKIGALAWRCRRCRTKPAHAHRHARPKPTGLPAADLSGPVLSPLTKAALSACANFPCVFHARLTHAGTLLRDSIFLFYAQYPA